MRREPDLLYELDETINQLLLADRPAVVVDLLDLELGSHILTVSQPNKNHCSLATCLGVLLCGLEGNWSNGNEPVWLRTVQRSQADVLGVVPGNLLLTLAPFLQSVASGMGHGRSG